MNRRDLWLKVAVTLVAGAALAVRADTWDGGGGGANWSEGANWLDDTAPGAAEMVVFDDTSLKGSAVDAPRNQRLIRYENTSGVHTTTIPAGVTLTVPDAGGFGYLASGYAPAGGPWNGEAVIRGGGELRFGASALHGDLYVGYKSSVSAVSATGRLTLDGVTLSQDSGIGLQLVYVGYDAQNGAAADSGVLDLRDAILPNNEFKARYLQIGVGDTAAGSLILPSSLKTFTAQASADGYGLICGSGLGATGLIDFDGNDTGAQLETVNLTPIAGTYGRLRLFAGAGTTLDGLPDTATWNVGAGTRRMNLELGYNDVNNAAMNPAGTLDISDGAFNAVTVGNLWVGYNSQANGAVTSMLNLSNATVTSGTTATPDMLDVLDLRVGNGVNAAGTIVLPSALTNLTVRPNADNYGLRVGEGRRAAGEINFDGGGTGSQLRSITVAPSTANYGTVNLAAGSGAATLSGLSNTVAWTLGSALQRTDLNVAANYDSGATNDSAFTLDISHGALNAVNLGRVRIGFDSQNRTTFETGVVDLAEATVTSGTNATPDVLEVVDLRVGSGVNADGALTLPSPLTNLTIRPGIENGNGLIVGSGLGAVGAIDFDGGGTGSQLRSVTVAPSSASYYGVISLADHSGSATLSGLPDTVSWTLGSAAKYVDVSLAHNTDAGAVNDTAITLDISDGAFHAVSLGTLSVARDTQNRTCAKTAELDLSRAAVSSGTGGSLQPGVLAIATALYVGNGRNAQGTLRLPANATVRVPNAYLAHASYADSSALVTLSNTTLQVATLLDVNPTATLEIAVDGISRGLDLTSATAGNFALDAGARVQVTFQSLPDDAMQDLWAVRKAGDHLTAFQTYAADGRFSATAAAFDAGLVTVWKDAAYTYYGLPARSVGLDTPGIATDPAGTLTPTTADLNGTLVSTGAAPTTVRVYWAGTDRYPAYAGWLGTNTWEATDEGAKTYTASGLATNTAYVYRYYATNSFGEYWGDAVGFVTHGPPVVTTLAPTVLGATSVTLNGNVVTTGGVATVVRVYWARSDRYPAHEGWLGTNVWDPSGTGAKAYTATNLYGGLLYDSRYYATNVYGESWGSAASFRPGAAGNLTWDGGAGADDNWSADANWGGDLAPAHPTTGTLTFGGADAGNVNVVDANRQIGGLTYTDTHTTDLGGNTLTVAGNVVAAGEGPDVATIQNGTLVVGSAGNPRGITVENANWNDFSLYLNNVTLNAWLNGLSVGTPTYSHSGSPSAVLDLSTCAVTTDGAANELRVSGSISLGPTGADNRGWAYVYLPDALTAISADNLYFNFTQVILPGAGAQLRTVTAVKDFRLCGTFGYNSGGGVYKLPDNVAMTVGTPAAPGTFHIGNLQWMPGELRMGAGGSFTAYLTSLTVGSGGNGGSDSVMDLSEVSSVSITSSGGMSIGTGGHNTTVKLGTGTVSTATVTVGALGTLDLYGTRLTVTNNTAGAVTISNSRVVRTYVGAESAGLDIRGPDASTLAIGASGLIDIRFTQDPPGGLLYGLKWAGNHTNDLIALGSKLTWDDSSLSGTYTNTTRIFYDPGSAATYVGIYAPLPSGFLMIVR